MNQLRKALVKKWYICVNTQSDFSDDLEMNSFVSSSSEFCTNFELISSGSWLLCTSYHCKKQEEITLVRFWLCEEFSCFRVGKTHTQGLTLNQARFPNVRVSCIVHSGCWKKTFYLHKNGHHFSVFRPPAFCCTRTSSVDFWCVFPTRPLICLEPLLSPRYSTWMHKRSADQSHTHLRTWRLLEIKSVRKELAHNYVGLSTEMGFFLCVFSAFMIWETHTSLQRQVALSHIRQITQLVVGTLACQICRFGHFVPPGPSGGIYFTLSQETLPWSQKKQFLSAK